MTAVTNVIVQTKAREILDKLDFIYSCKESEQVVYWEKDDLREENTTAQGWQ